MNHSAEIIEVPCEQVRLGERHRKEMGDLEALAESIATEGLLQPIGITEDGELVFGQRWLLAVMDAGELSIGAAAVIAQEPAEAIALLKPEGELA